MQMVKFQKNHMRSIGIVFLLICKLACIPLLAQQQNARIQFENKEYDFGTFRESDGVVSHNFTFTNNGNAPLIIKDVRASCGCTTPEWTREPVLPGKRGHISVSYNPKNRPGSFNKGVVVTSNADVPSVKLLIKGVVVPVDQVHETYRFAVGDLRLETIYVSFGDIYKDDEAVYNLRVYNSSDNKAIQPAFQKLPPHISITINPEIIEPMQEGIITLRYSTSLKQDWGYTVDRISLLVNGEQLLNNRINITANIREDFSGLTATGLLTAPRLVFDTTSFDFGKIGQDQVIEHAFRLTNMGKSDLYIRKVSASCGCTAVQPEKTVIPPGGSTIIKAVFNPAGREGNQKKAITVITNDPKRSKMILWINGIVENSSASKKP
jgi:hypothetical protein